MEVFIQISRNVNWFDNGRKLLQHVVEFRNYPNASTQIDIYKD